MSNLNRTNLQTLYGTSGTTFPDNQTGEISEQDMRTFGQDVTDSTLNKTDDVYTLVFPQATASGTDTYAATLNPAITAYANAQKFQIKFTNASTSDSTLNLNGIGDKKIYTNPTSQVGTGEITAGQIYFLIYDTALDSAAGGFLMIGGSSTGGGGGGVTSVNGDSGPSVTLVAGDIAFTPVGGIAATDVQAALSELDTEVDSRITAAISGLKWKDAVRVATTVNGTLASAYENGDTVDGVVLATGNRILLKNQTTQTENGIYTVNGAGAPTRAVDADTGTELEGAAVSVSEGTANANTTWIQTTDGLTLGSSNIVFTQFGSSTTDADATTKGIAKLYPSTSLGTNTDGAPTQNAVKVYADLRLLITDFAKYIIDQATTSTSGGTITLDMNSQVQRSHVGSATFSAAKAVAMSNTTNSFFFNWVFEVTSVSAVLTFPSDWLSSSPDFNGSTWTPPTTGKFEFGGSFDDVNNVWYVKVAGPFI